MRGFLFDLDGVLVHTDRFHYLAWKQLSDKLNIYFDEEINNRCRGVSRMESLDIILENAKQSYTVKEKEAFAARKNKAYQSFLREMSPDDVTEEVRSVLHTLREKGFLLAIGSSSKNAKLILEQTQLTHYFDAISDGNNITHSKPHPEVFLKAAEYLNLNPSDCFVIEDAVAGIEAGRAAGSKTIAIGDAANATIADENISSLSDLLHLI